MKTTFLVGITGKAGSGKDTLAYMMGFERYAFASPLKAGLRAMGFPEPERKLKESKIPGFEFTWRLAAQRLGTEWGRGLQDDIWLAMAERARLSCPAGVMTITDVRFHNEADWVRDHGVLIHVKGRATTVSGELERRHASELDLPVDGQVDMVVQNTGSLNFLQQEASRIAQIVLAKA